MNTRSYICIDLKSFFASVECVERGLDPMNTCLVVADMSRTEKTICLAVTPALKSYGVPGRPRLFEVIERVRAVNRAREKKSGVLTGKSCEASRLDAEQSLALDYLVAPPQMAKYIKYSSDIYKIYLKYFAPEDIHVYSIDEVFIDATSYLKTYRMSPRALTEKVIGDVFSSTGITATAGIGTNMYLGKVAMDIIAKKMPPDKNGARIACLDETSYRRLLWEHRPITDFWRVGHGTARRLEKCGIYTMGDIAACSVGEHGDYYNEALLYRLFGVNAELLIDHAWGWEPCTMEEIKAYRPASSSLCSGQVLTRPYAFDEARIIVREMADALALDLVSKCHVTDRLTLDVMYDTENLTDPRRASEYEGKVVTDYYGRQAPAHAHGTVNLQEQTSSSRLMVNAVSDLFDRIADRRLTVRKVNISACCLVPESAPGDSFAGEQLDMFTDYRALEEARAAHRGALAREKREQSAILDIRGRYGKTAIFRGVSMTRGATGIERNRQIGGHRA